MQLEPSVLIPIAIFTVAGLAALVIYVVFRRREAERARALLELSHKIGFSYADRDDQVLELGFADSHLFARGRSRKVRNLLRRSENDGETLLFDYQYTIQSGKSSHTTRQTVAVLSTPRDLPQFELRPERVYHRVGTALGYQDIDIEGQPEFSSSYLLRGADEKAIRRMFSSSMARDLAGRPGWSVEGKERWLTIYRHGKRVRPDEMIGFLEEARELRRTVTAE